MNITRKDFLKAVGVGISVAAVNKIGISSLAAETYSKELKIKGAKEVNSICPFCSVSCHFIAHVKGGAVVSTEGDPGYPVSEGALCAKGSTMLSMINSEHRVLKPMYRAPFSDKWEEKDWDWMLDKLAKKIKETRDRDFKTTNAAGQKINRIDSMFHMGSSQMSNEEASVVVQAVRAMGIVNLDHQARI